MSTLAKRVNEQVKQSKQRRATAVALENWTFDSTGQPSVQLVLYNAHVHCIQLFI